MKAGMEESREMLELLVGIIYKSHSTGILQKMDDYELTFLQRSILRYISRRKQTNMAELSDMIATSKPSMTRIIDSLERKGFVKRMEVAGDRRSYNIVLTDKGRGMLSKMDDEPLKNMNKLFENCSADEKKGIIKYFDLFLSKLNQL